MEMILHQSGAIVNSEVEQISETTENVNEYIKVSKRETAELENLDRRLGVLESAISDRKKVASRVRDKLQRIDSELL